MEELTKTYTLTHSTDGWRVNFSGGFAPDLGLEPQYSLFEVIDRIETLYPDYRPRLTVTQLADHQLQLARRGHAQQLQKLSWQTGELGDGLIDLAKKLPQIGANQDRAIAEDLATLHHQLSDLRAHVDIARRVVLARRIGQPAGLVSDRELAKPSSGPSGPNEEYFHADRYVSGQVIDKQCIT